MPKIAVLMGGQSMERSISLKSGHRVSNALGSKGYDVIELDLDESLVPTLLSEKPDLVYIALHGKFGEDGTIQELLEIIGIPYTGPGPLSSIIGFNKVLSKELFGANGIPTPRFFTLNMPTFEEMGASKLLAVAWEKLGSPVVVKPASQGSALGVKVVEDYKELPDALLGAFSYDDRILLEQHVSGTEISISVLGNDDRSALPAVEVVPENGFFDYESRYTAGKTDYFVPARLDEPVLKKAEEVALAAHNLLKCKDLSRVDMIVGEDNVPYVLEVNISPGMTETSLLPLAAEAAGVSFQELVDRLVELALPHPD